MKLAIFDFDGTIYKKETFNILMYHLKRSYPKRYRRFYASILPVYIGFKIKLVNEKKMKKQIMKRYALSLKGFTEETTERFFAKAAQRMQEDFNLEVVRQLKAHQQAGDFTVILSGAFTPLLSAVDTMLQLETNRIIGTKLPRSGEVFTHVHGEEKVCVLKEAFKDIEIDWQASSAYGDSAADLAILNLVGHPVAVSPDEKLEQEAAKLGWNRIN